MMKNWRKRGSDFITEEIDLELKDKIESWLIWRISDSSITSFELNWWDKSSQRNGRHEKASTFLCSLVFF